MSRIPRSAATIIPFDVSSRVELLQQRQAAGVAKTVDMPGDTEQTGNGQAADQPRPGKAKAARKAKDPEGHYRRPVPSAGTNPIGSLAGPGPATVEGRVRSVEIRPVEHNSVLACEISDSTGELTALFYGRTHIPGVTCGSRIRFRGSVGIKKGHPFMVNPTYELLGPADPDTGGESGNGD